MGLNIYCLLHCKVDNTVCSLDLMRLKEERKKIKRKEKYSKRSEMKKGDFMLHGSERYFWYNQPRRPLGIGGKAPATRNYNTISSGTNTNRVS